MQIDRIQVTYGGKLNLGNYQSAEISASVGAALDAGDDPDQVAEELFNQARDMVIARAAPLIREKNALVDGVFTSLPTNVRNNLK